VADEPATSVGAVLGGLHGGGRIRDPMSLWLTGDGVLFLYVRDTPFVPEFPDERRKATFGLTNERREAAFGLTDRNLTILFRMGERGLVAFGISSRRRGRNRANEERP
jgi:hypothetical protein